MVTFLLVELHHRRLHEAGGMPAVGIACPVCRLEYFAEQAGFPMGPAGETVCDAAYQVLRSECPDHSHRFAVPSGR